MLQVGVLPEEVEATQKCIDSGEGQQMYDLSTAYTTLALDSVHRRMQGCTIRVLDHGGKEKSICVRDRSMYSSSCGTRASPQSWIYHLCSTLRMQSRREAYKETASVVSKVCDMLN